MLAKFSAPEAPRFLFGRPGLKARLGRWTEFPLTQVAAPAGYGKTTLVADALRDWTGAKCWITLDEGDADPARFLATLAQGLSQAHPRLAEIIRHSPSAFSSPDPEHLLARLSEALDELPCQLVTVIDDCALLASPQARRMAARFLSSAASRARFILLTRDAGVLPISRWRLRQEMLELGPEDLALGEGEFAAWMEERIGVLPAPDLRARLHGLFEGWLAGLQLLALKLDKEPDRLAALESLRPGNPLLFDYLLEEVLRRSPPEWRRFLLETSILETLHPDLCDEVRQAGNSAHLLHAVHQAQGFLVPLAGGKGYRYHRLFAESLRGLMDQWDPGLAPTLHRRAARWHLVRGSLDSALEHALAAADGDTLEALAARALENLFRNSEFAALQRHLRRIPEPLCRGRPWLSIFCAWACFHAGREGEGEARLAEAERILLLEGPPESASRPALRAQWAHLLLLRGILARLDGAFAKALERVRRAEALAPRDALFLRASLASQAAVTRFMSGDPGAAEPVLARTLEEAGRAGHHLAYFGAAYTLAEVLGQQGRLAEAGALLDACAGRAASLPDRGGPAAGYARIARARWLRMLGRADEALAEAAAGIAAGQAGGNIRILNYGHATAALLLMDAGEADAAFAHLEKAEAYAMRNRMHWAVDLDDLRAMRVRCLGPARERPSADAWMAREKAGVARPSWSALDRCRTACAWLEWRGRPSEAERLAALWAGFGERAGGLWPAREFRLAAARAAALAGNAPAQRRHLAAAASLADRIGLGALRDGSGAAPLAEAAVVAARAGEDAAPGSDLSEREIEVLKAMREGKSNKEIAGSLFVAPSTVKTHLKNIFVKLGVDNRLRAVTRAVENGILR